MLKILGIQTEQARSLQNGGFEFLDPAIVRGYDHKDWIMYETGEVISSKSIEKKCIEILSNPDVAYVHVRSRFNCFQCRVERA